MDEKTTLSTTYVINNSNRFVTLSLIIGGPEQTATSLVAIDDVPFDPINGDVFDMELGKNSELDNKMLTIITTVTDMAPDHNHTELIIRLKGGSAFREFPLSQEVKDGETVTYVCRITFFNLS